MLIKRNLTQYKIRNFSHTLFQSYYIILLFIIRRGVSYENLPGQCVPLERSHRSTCTVPVWCCTVPVRDQSLKIVHCTYVTISQHRTSPWYGTGASTSTSTGSTNFIFVWLCHMYRSKTIKTVIGTIKRYRIIDFF